MQMLDSGLCRAEISFLLGEPVTEEELSRTFRNAVAKLPDSELVSASCQSGYRLTPKHLKNVRLHLVEDRPLVFHKAIMCCEDAAECVREYLHMQPHECVGALFLDQACNPICFSRIAEGAVTEAYVSPAEIIKTALLANAVNVILFHNHPSGNVTPSAHDDVITEKVKKACALMDITLLDHVIVGAYGNRVYSFQREGRL